MAQHIPSQEVLDYYKNMMLEDPDIKHMVDFKYNDLPFPPQFEDPEWFIPVVSRDEWGALPPKAKGEILKIPVMYISYTWIGKDECSSVEDCSKFMRKLQKKSMDEGLSDIPYNFVVGGKGIVYEGRGWETEAVREDKMNDFEGLHGKLKGQTVDIAYVGDMSVYGPSNEMQMGASQFVMENVKKEMIHLMFQVIPYRARPGDSTFNTVLQLDTSDPNRTK